MVRRPFVLAASAFALAVASFAPPVLAQADLAAMAAQKEAMKSLSSLDGTWRGPAWVLLPTGEKKELTQTERVGSFMDGTIKVIEGRGYNADGSEGFNAFGIVSYDAASRQYTMRSYAMGRAGDFTLTPTADGFTWEHPMGPAMKIRYTATVKNGEWRQVGERIAEGQAPVQMLEMNLKRIGDTDWPAAGAVPAK
jgi:hypothetical protein